MKAHYRTETGHLTFEVEGGPKEIFAGIAGIQEVFEADTTCGCCGKARIRFRVRAADDNSFYELVCMDCHATLAFGQTKVGNRLFAKRKEGDRWLPDRGWKVWKAGVAEESKLVVESAKW